jgi:hypothetical protein
MSMPREGTGRSIYFAFRVRNGARVR